MHLDTRSVRWGVVGAAAMLAFCTGVLVGASGWAHLGEQLRSDWYLVGLIIAGFGVQVALMVELRHRHRLYATEATASGAGAGASAMGMLACCAHHLIDIAPIVGATGALAFLANYRVAFMVGGIVLNAIGITIASRRLRQLDPHHLEGASCAPA
jgi:Cu+-exporting ATPase